MWEQGKRTAWLDEEDFNEQLGDIKKQEEDDIKQQNVSDLQRKLNNQMKHYED